jgi:hypothetical protein
MLESASPIALADGADSSRCMPWTNLIRNASPFLDGHRIQQNSGYLALQVPSLDFFQPNLEILPENYPIG